MVNNEKIFSNIMGPTATKNFKVLSAALDLMQRPNKYLGKEMTELNKMKLDQLQLE
jgi:hypothetical protein